VFGSKVNHHCSLGVTISRSFVDSLATIRPSGLVSSGVDDHVWGIRRSLLRGKLCSEDGIKVTGVRGGKHCVSVSYTG
jgi:hypothetical protein